jgi:hypothetical protein
MLFDLRSRGRRRTVQVLYLGLAILIGGGLILFGVGTGSGGGGLLNGLTGSGTNSGQTQAISQAAKSALKQVKLHPNYPVAWSNLEQAYWEAAHQSSDYDSTTGGYTTTGRKYLADATGAWQRYLGLTKSPNADAAILAAEAYASLAQYRQEASSWQYVIQTNPSSAKGYECLAFSAYAAKETRLASLAAAQALRRAPKLEKLQLTSALKSAKTQPQYAQEC